MQGLKIITTVLSTLSRPQLTALSVLASYFVVIAALLGLIVRSMPKPDTSARARQRNAFAILALGAFGHTWYYMFSFMKWSYDDWLATHASISSPSFKLATPLPTSLLERIANWLVDTPLFEQAWSAVCRTPLNWWWSEQLCVYTAAGFTVVLFLESRRYGIKHAWSYMLLGQLVAISVASALFFLALSSAPTPPPPSLVSLAPPAAPPSFINRPEGSIKSKPTKNNKSTTNATAPVTVTAKSTRKTRPTRTPVPRRAPLLLWAPVLISLCTTIFVPSTTTKTFLPNLLVMHALLVVPLLPLPSSLASFGSLPQSKESKESIEYDKTSMSVEKLHGISTLIALVLRLRMFRTVFFPTLVPALRSALRSTFSSFSNLSSSPIASTSTSLFTSWNAVLDTLVVRVSDVIGTIHSHPAQSSIGWDVVWSCAVLVVWGVFEGRAGPEGVNGVNGVMNASVQAGVVDAGMDDVNEMDEVLASSGITTTGAADADADAEVDAEVEDIVRRSRMRQQAARAAQATKMLQDARTSKMNTLSSQGSAGQEGRTTSQAKRGKSAIDLLASVAGGPLSGLFPIDALQGLMRGERALVEQAVEVEEMGGGWGKDE